MTPLAIDLASQRGRTPRQEPKAPRAVRSAVYLPYRRRSANGTVRVATGLVGRTAR